LSYFIFVVIRFIYFCRNRAYGRKAKQRKSVKKVWSLFYSSISDAFYYCYFLWGGNKLSEYYQLKTKLLTVAIGFAGLCLAMYVTLKRLDEINRREEESNKK
jgi:hypothetical protein